MLNSCQNDCDRSAWRYCPHCGRLLRETQPAARRRPSVGEFASLRAKGLTYKEIGQRFGFAGPGPTRQVEARAMHDWQRASTRRLAHSYQEGGGALRPPEEPGDPRSWNDREAVDAYHEARREYDRARRQWEEAIGVPMLSPIRRAGSVPFWRAAVAGELPGPISRWPEAE